MISAIIILVLLGLLDIMLFIACVELEKEQEEQEKWTRRGCEHEWLHNNSGHAGDPLHASEISKTADDNQTRGRYPDGHEDL